MMGNEEYTNENLIDNLDSIIETAGKTVLSINSIVGELFRSETIKCLIEAINSLNIIMSSDYMKSFYEAVYGFAGALKKAYEYPYRVQNYTKYLDELETFHWAWPFRIKEGEVQELLKGAHNEYDFDKIMLSFFTNERICIMFDYIVQNSPRKNKIIIKQIRKAYADKQYALVNVALVTIIDNFLSNLLIKKRNNKRMEIIEPVILFYEQNYQLSDIEFIFFLKMLSNNIKFVYRNVDFDKQIKIKSNKNANRNLFSHGVMYSNKRVDTVMLLNTLVAIIDNKKYIQPFYGTIDFDTQKQKFVYVCKEYVIRNRIRKSLGISIQK